MENSTIFDDVFQTIKEKMPELVIPLINGAFGTTYALDAPILRGENEHHTANGKVSRIPVYYIYVETTRKNV